MERRRGPGPENTFGAGQILEQENFGQALTAQVEVSQRLNVACAMLLLKLEYEDLYRERYGEDALKYVRNAFSRLVFANVRDTDTVGWAKPGCLGVILRVISAKDTGLVATRLQKRMAKHPILVGNVNLHLAVQVGGVWYSGQRQMSPDELTQQAFDALAG
ncbi:MAG: hypothetical protein AAFX99_08355 [Myxococcota bacterium]